jgi:hypothetical protein
MISRYRFQAGTVGPWRIDRISAVRGAGLPAAARLAILPEPDSPPDGGAWALHGVISNLRYATGDEVAGLRAVQPGLGRAEARAAALIPIRKTQAWWDLPQDARRAIFEETSHHTRTGMEYLPQVARRLLHSRDLGEPFDFLTWFEFHPAHEAEFDALLVRMRATAEWDYVEGEVDIRLRLD